MSQIKHFDGNLIISHKDQYHRLSQESMTLAKLIQSKGVDVILTPVTWPRDTFHFLNENEMMEVDSTNEKQVKYSKHYAWWGGAYLRGDDFIIGESNGIPIKRKPTETELNVSKGFYLNTRKYFDHFKNISVSDRTDFYSPKSYHIDPFFNLTNHIKAIYSWNISELVKDIEPVAKETKYDLITLPLEEAKFASMGFIELGDHVVIDCRATKTIEILENIGYKVIPTPLPLKQRNKYKGSLRCATKEAPKIKHKMKFHPFKLQHDVDGPAKYSLFSNLNEEMMIMDNSEKRKLVHDLFSEDVYQN